jgi:hypothetical protein
MVDANGYLLLPTENSKLYIKMRRLNILALTVAGLALIAAMDTINEVINRKTIGISRCPQCVEIYKTASSKAKWYALGIGVAVFIFTFILAGIYIGFETDLLFVIGLTLVFGILFGVAAEYSSFNAIKNRFVKRNGILTERKAAMKYSLVQIFISDGLKFE